MRFLVFFIILSCTTHSAWSINCDTLLRELADKQSLFVYCNTKHAIPIPPQNVRLCGGCNDFYTEMTIKYNNLMQVENCSKLYMDSDRINIVSTTQNALKGLWDRAYCEECFKDNNSNNFTELYDDLSSCLDSHKGSECTSCVGEYITMNDFYKNLDQKNNGHMCFDMQDMMNRTRVLWSKDLKCCQREVKMTIFLSSVAVVAVLPILLFYSAAFLLTKRREANHGLLNEHEPELDTPSTSSIIAAAVLSTRTEPPAVVDARAEKISKLLVHSQNMDSSSDDESVIKSKLN